MQSLDVAPVPYEAQADLSTHRRMCGAAALRMVYLSFGLDQPQASIWPRVSRVDAQGTYWGHTHLLAADAHKQGLDAVVVRSRRPQTTLRNCLESSARVIVNCRTRPYGRSGHYAVLLGISNDAVQLHDPQLGPACRLSWEEFDQRWRPQSSSPDVAGYVLIAIDAKGTTSNVCDVCQRQLPASLDCRRCHRPIPLRPVAALGCTYDDCSARLWRWVFCPQCDASYSTCIGAGCSLHITKIG